MNPPASFDERFRDTICSAYSYDELHIFCTDVLSLDLKTIVQDTVLPTVGLELIGWARRHSFMTDLVRGAATKRPKRTDLAALWREYSATTQPQGESGLSPFGDPPGGFRAAVLAFRDALDNRDREFRFLRANKCLHDVLHKLQRLQKQIVETTDHLAEKKVASPDSRRVIRILREQVVEAKKHAVVAREGGQPKDALDWVQRFEEAVDAIDPETYKQGEEPLLTPGVAVEILDNLPTQNQPGLNTEIYTQARALNTNGLIDLARRIPSQDAPNLRVKLDEFVDTCREVLDLINDHNLCQNIDRDFAAVVGVLPEKKPKKWEPLKRALTAIAERHDHTNTLSQAVDAFDDVVRKFFDTNPPSGDGEKVSESAGKLRDEFQLLFQSVDGVLRLKVDGIPVVLLKLRPLLDGYLTP